MHQIVVFFLVVYQVKVSLGIFQFTLPILSDKLKQLAYEPKNNNNNINNNPGDINTLQLNGNNKLRGSLIDYINFKRRFHIIGKRSRNDETKTILKYRTLLNVLNDFENFY